MFSWRSPVTLIPAGPSLLLYLKCASGTTRPAWQGKPFLVEHRAAQGKWKAPAAISPNCPAQPSHPQCLTAHTAAKLHMQQQTKLTHQARMLTAP